MIRARFQTWAIWFSKPFFYPRVASKMQIQTEDLVQYFTEGQRQRNKASSEESSFNLDLLNKTAPEGCF